MKISSVIRDAMPTHFKKTDVIYDFISAADEVFDEIHTKTKGLVKEVSDIDYCDIRYIKPIADTLGITNISFMGVENLDPDNGLMLEIIEFLNEATTFNGGKDFVTTSTTAKFDTELLEDQHANSCPGPNTGDPLKNLPEYIAEAISVNPKDTSGNDLNPVSDLYCEINTTTISTILDQTMNPGSKQVTEDGILLCHAFGVEYTKYLETNKLPQLYSILTDHMNKLVNKLKWYRKMIKETVLRYQDKGSRKAIETMFSDYILREFSDYGKGLKGTEFPGILPEGGYVVRTAMSTESFVDNGFRVEMVELSDPWDYFTGDPSIIHDPLVNDPDLYDYYNMDAEEGHINSESLNAMINMFPNSYADSSYNGIVGDNSGDVISDEDLANGTYTGFPRFPYNALAYDESYVDGNPWEFTTESIPQAIEIIRTGNGFMETVKSYHQYKRRRTPIADWDAGSVSTAEEIFVDPSMEQYPMSAHNYEESLRNLVPGIEANWGNFISNTRGTAATMIDAYDQSEFDDIYHYFSFENQDTISYLDPETVDNEPAEELHQIFRSFDAYLTQEESFGYNPVCPTLANGEWGEDGADIMYKYKGMAAKNYESDIYSNRYLLLCPASAQIKSNPTRDQVTSNHIHTLTGGSIVIKDGTDEGVWDEFSISYIPTFTNGSLYDMGMISDTMFVVGDTDISTNTRHIAFIKLGEDGPITSTVNAPLLANINEDYIYGRLDAETGKFVYVTKFLFSPGEYLYNLYSYDPDEHNITSLVSGLIPTHQVADSMVEVYYPESEASMVVIYEKDDEMWLDRLSKRHGRSSMTIDIATVAPGYVEMVGAISSFGGGNLMVMYNTNNNPTVFGSVPVLYTSFIHFDRFFKNSDVNTDIPTETSNFTYKHSGEDGEGDAYAVDPGDGNKPEMSFLANRVQIIDWAINDQIVAFLTAPMAGIYDYTSYNSTQNGPKLIGDYSYWSDSSNFGMVDNNGTIEYDDLGLGEQQHFNNFGHFNLDTDLIVSTGGVTSAVKMAYNMANVKSQYRLDETHPDTSYYLPTEMSIGDINHRKYWRVKLNETIYFSMYDDSDYAHDPILSTTGVGMVEGVSEWNLFNPGLVKTGLFDIKIHNFVFSPTLTSSQIMATKESIESAIRNSIDVVKPGHTSLRKIAWINPVIGEMPEYTVPGPYGIEFDDSYIQIIDKDGEEVLTVVGTDPNRFQCSSIYDLLVNGSGITSLLTTTTDIQISTTDDNNDLQTADPIN